MSYCIFDNEPDANAYQDQAYADWIAAHNTSPYREQTTAWAIPFQRLTDNKWAVQVCPITDNTGQAIEPGDPSWWPDPEP